MEWYQWIAGMVIFALFTWAVHTRAKDKGHEEVFYHLDRALLKEQMKTHLAPKKCICGDDRCTAHKGV